MRNGRGCGRAAWLPRRTPSAWRARLWRRCGGSIRPCSGATLVEYAAGIVLLVVFLGQLAMGDDRIGALVGIGSVGFVIGYLWWKHRGLQPLDPGADAIAYKAALLARLDEQIHLLRSVTYWYLLPLSLPSLWQAVHVWDKSPWAAAVSLAVVVVLFVFLRWLNLTAGVGALRATRANVESMFPMK